VTVSDHLTAAEAFLAQLRQVALIGEAEDLARGVRHLSVVTGDFETADDVARVEELTAAGAGARHDQPPGRIRLAGLNGAVSAELANELNAGS
jgi:hypothetical protein